MGQRELPFVLPEPGCGSSTAGVGGGSRARMMLCVPSSLPASLQMMPVETKSRSIAYLARERETATMRMGSRTNRRAGTTDSSTDPCPNGIREPKDSDSGSLGYRLCVSITLATREKKSGWPASVNPSRIPTETRAGADRPADDTGYAGRQVVGIYLIRGLAAS